MRLGSSASRATEPRSRARTPVWEDAEEGLAILRRPSVTVRALAGLAALNLAYVLVGLSFLWGVRGFRTWGAVLRLTGLGYLLGVAAFGVAWTALLVVGCPVRRAPGRGVARRPRCGRCRRRVAPRRRRSRAVSRCLVARRCCSSRQPASRSPGSFSRRSSARRGSRASRHTTRGRSGCRKARRSTSSGASTSTCSRRRRTPTYPPLLPILDAAAFHAMGGADVVTLHLQFWFLVVGAVAAIAGLLHRHAPAVAPLAVPPRSSSSCRASASGC